jgi:xylulokinase
MNMHILGLDIGTSGVKAILFDETWKAIGQSYREYHLISAGEDRFDLDAETVWKKTREAIIEIADSTGQAIDAVAVSALGDVIISLDERGNTVRPSILDFDPRGKEEIQGFIEDFGAERFYKITGMPPIHINSLAKILWIKKHEPHNYRRVRSWATYEDYVLRKLGVRPTISYSMAARTMLFDSTHKTWSQEVLTAAGLEEGSFPKAVPSGMVIDTLRRDVSRELGFSRDAVACSGGHDMVCAAIGAGLDEGDPHTALNIVGTMEGVIVLLQKPKVNREMLKRLYPCYPGYREYISLSVNLTSGSVVKWYRDVISYKTMGNGEEKSFEELLQSIDEKEPGNLFLIPHFSGTCNPVFDPGARGFFYGLSLHTTMQDLIQGIIEGLCYELKMHIQGFNDAGISIEGLKTVGGGSQSSKWLQLKANITGLDSLTIPMRLVVLWE